MLYYWWTRKEEEEKALSNARRLAEGVELLQVLSDAVDGSEHLVELVLYKTKRK